MNVTEPREEILTLLEQWEGHDAAIKQIRAKIADLAGGGEAPAPKRREADRKKEAASAGQGRAAQDTKPRKPPTRGSRSWKALTSLRDAGGTAHLAAVTPNMGYRGCTEAKARRRTSNVLRDLRGRGYTELPEGRGGPWSLSDRGVELVGAPKKETPPSDKPTGAPDEQPSGDPSGTAHGAKAVGAAVLRIGGGT